ncbi:hypothetical protein SPTER_10200 [Sporomusa termitida]|uniref:Uncharacterized protein n=1 Tax=Sporomusa termitida TaxID=2377 RepID=A0A517DQU3_9FIRM|nr:hypothetical protein SPTER_10200 [Sporomusa termitida]
MLRETRDCEHLPVLPKYPATLLYHTPVLAKNKTKPAYVLYTERNLGALHCQLGIFQDDALNELAYFLTEIKCIFQM